MSDAGIYACEVHRKWVKKRDRHFAYLTVLGENFVIGEHSSSLASS